MSGGFIKTEEWSWFCKYLESRRETEFLERVIEDQCFWFRCLIEEGKNWQYDPVFLEDSIKKLMAAVLKTKMSNNELPRNP